jgi:hypothetical protein
MRGPCGDDAIYYSFNTRRVCVSVCVCVRYRSAARSQRTVTLIVLETPRYEILRRRRVEYI